MQISAATANSLAQKLTQLDLNDEEAVLLSTLVAEESEVMGFELDKASPKIQALKPLIAGPIKSRWIIIESYTEVEWT